MECVIIIINETKEKITHILNWKNIINERKYQLLYWYFQLLIRTK